MTRPTAPQPRAGTRNPAFRWLVGLIAMTGLSLAIVSAPTLATSQVAAVVGEVPYSTATADPFQAAPVLPDAGSDPELAPATGPAPAVDPAEIVVPEPPALPVDSAPAPEPADATVPEPTDITVASDPSPIVVVPASEPASSAVVAEKESVVPTPKSSVVKSSEQSPRGSAPAADAIDQCNDVGSIGADTITCTITVTNNCTYNPATPDNPTCAATIETQISCTGSAACPPGGTTTQATPVTVITQCNNAGMGGASTVTCTVTVVNNLTGYPLGTIVQSSVQQCQNPGEVSTLTCVATPPGNDREGDVGPGGQSITQCNDSGGAGGTMTCTATAPPTQSTGLPTTINQCNASGPLGASTVTCTATITNNCIECFEGSGPGDGGSGDGGPGGGGPDGSGPGGGGPDGGGPGGGGSGPGDNPPGNGGGGPGTPTGDTPPTAGDTPPSDEGGPPSTSGGPPGDHDNPPVTGGGNGHLPFTGSDARLPVLAGALLILLGLGLSRVTTSRRRNA